MPERYTFRKALKVQGLIIHNRWLLFRASRHLRRGDPLLASVFTAQIERNISRCKELMG